MIPEVGYREMRTLILVFFAVTVFDSYADFSIESVKSWVGTMYNEGSSKVGASIDELKSSSMGKKVGDFWDQTKDTLQENRRGTVTDEFLEVRKNFADYASKLNKELEEDIRSLSQLKDVRYHDRVVIYKDGKQYVTALEECLSRKLESFADAKEMKDAAHDHMDSILNILTDELIYSYVSDLREAYIAFNNAFDTLKNQLKTKQ